MSKTYKDVEIDHKTNPRKFDSIKDHVYDILLTSKLNPELLNPIVAYKNKKRVIDILEGKQPKNYDEKTGLYLKDRDFSEAEDIKNVNPNFDTLLPGSRTNCMLCSMTMEMRKRGYDVSAMRDTGSGYYGEEISRFFPGAKAKLAGLRSEFDNVNSYVNHSISEIKKNPNGSRGEITVSWLGNSEDEMFGDHAMYWEIKDNKLRIIDAQCRMVFDNPSEILAGTKMVNYTRLDNLPFNSEELKKEVLM